MEVDRPGAGAAGQVTISNFTSESVPNGRGNTTWVERRDFLLHTDTRLLLQVLPNFSELALAIASMQKAALVPIDGWRDDWPVLLLVRPECEAEKDVWAAVGFSS